MLIKQVICSIFMVFILNQGSTQALLFDWMLPNFWVVEDPILGIDFKNGMKTLKESMENLHANMEKLNKDFQLIKNYSSLDLASVIYSNNSDPSVYYSLGGCDCVNTTCTCCSHLEIEKLNLNDTACLKLTYLNVDVGLKMEFSINGVVYYNQTISESNPPLVCVGIPDVKEAGSLCLRFYDLVIRNQTITGCLDVIAKLLNVEVARVKIGCFRSAPSSKFYQQNVISYHKFGNTTYYNQFNSDASNLIVKTISILNNIGESGSKIVSSNNIFSNVEKSDFNNWKLDTSDLIFKRKKRD